MAATSQGVSALPRPTPGCGTLPATVTFSKVRGCDAQPEERELAAVCHPSESLATAHIKPGDVSQLMQLCVAVVIVCFAHLSY